ncbi:class I SAM-dependent methyltransferase [Endozoicomonas ascidiicola]|uniref:class I SAM-dependent methyltransferase n=1 Tax=Endozoicomonas ascidiicola TaxID=1698521 RepID=UPI00082CF0BB|nr:class I SAM-dependent methyltransferase [Endozoicomonas ascidiicola]
MHWDRYASKDTKRILDLGCGDGDVTQRIIEYIVAIWEKEGYEGHELEVVGLDLNISRVENALVHVSPLHPKITVKFETCNVVQDGIPFDDGYFDHSLTTGVIEILSDDAAVRYCDEMSGVTTHSIYI